ncbi:MAG: ATP-binding cassette domain-containing protein [Saprospiraceae bacterium]
MMTTDVLKIENVTKTYQDYKAVNDVSLAVKEGSIFGLLGPNGAGKTTLIRMITTITMPDSGTISLNGNVLEQINPLDLGYMPEERGLYKKMKVGEQLLYLAQLKGLTKTEAMSNISYWFKKFDIESWWDKKISELSKGMSQKVQFIATVVHNPKLIILDEPFTGLDPINTNLIKDEIFNLKKAGASIIFSTHRMEQVEQICDRIVLINKGKIILNGEVNVIKNEYKNYTFHIKFSGELPENIQIDGAEIEKGENNTLVIKGHPGTKSNDILLQLIRRDIEILEFQEILPSLSEIFIKKVASTYA